MFEQYKYKTELHAHTTPASTCSQITPEHMIEVYSKLGYTSIALTNHLITEERDGKEKIKSYLDDFYKTRELGKKQGINVILGAEIRFTENVNDYLIYGIDEDELITIYDMLDLGIKEFYKQYKNEKNIIIQAHPFRDMITPVEYNSVDGYEVFNLHPGHNSRIGFAAQYAKAQGGIITAGTDYHHFNHEGMCAIITKEAVTNSVNLASILKNNDYLIEVSGNIIIPNREL